MSAKRPRQEEGTDKRKRHRPGTPKEDRRPAWKLAQDLPAFLDASASVSASTFGARRLPEIKALWNTTVRPRTELIPSEESLKSSGGKTSSRHLRRRTTSHNSRKRHRFPNNATSQETPNNKEMLTRRSTRKDKSALQKEHHLWWKMEEQSTPKDDVVWNQPEKEPSSNSKEKNTIHWMTTHLWHAKRFHMSELWGWKIPMAHTNRGAKAALRLIREGKSLLEDATWQMAQPMHFVAPGMDQQETITATIRRVCPEFQMNNLSMAAATSTSTGQGMIYALDRFPRNAIGPVTWLVSSNRPLMGAQVDPTDAKHCYIYFWVHPSIEGDVLDEFKALRDETSSATPLVMQRLQVGFQAENMGMACLQLRGTNVTSTVQKSIVDPTNVPGMNPLCRAGNQSLLDDEEFHFHVPHGTVVPACANCDSLPSNATDRNTTTNAWINGNYIVLISQCFRDPGNVPQNAPAWGWNILCDASIAKDLFLKLVLSGQACPIGVTESAYINLECEPPMANVFPRDYPETQQGRDYWQLNTAGKSCDDLQVLRLCLEESTAGARVPVTLINKRVRLPPPKQPRMPKVSTQRLCKIEWNNLVTKETDGDNADSEEKDDAESEVVVMRGIFGQPLVDALSGAGTIPFRDDPSKPTRRKRRRSKQPNEFCRALPLTPEDAEKHLATCTSLLESLSLPAVVACRLQIVGSGTISPGAEIHSCEDDQESSRFLGYTTTGCFSVSRGSSHGIGVVGAANLLRAILWGSSSAQRSMRAFAVVGSRSSNNGKDKRQIHLQVEIKTKGISTKATLALSL